MPRNARALHTTFQDLANVDPIADDIDDCDLVYLEQSAIDMIEEERCPLADGRHDDGLHLYLDGQNHCCRCAMAAPWVRRDQCRS